MNILGLIKKAITGGEWFIAFREKGEDRYRTIKAPLGQWCADPFLYEVDGEHYIFVEQYDVKKEKGSIGYFKIENGMPVNKGIIIENNYHMSYPCVFEYEGNHYMIPESSANSTIDLYMADSFPEKWHKEKTLVSGAKWVDSTVFQEGDQFYLFSYKLQGYVLQVFRLEMSTKQLFKLSTMQFAQNTGRPAGRLYYKNGQLIRPAQDCSRKYGEKILLNYLESFKDKIVENRINTITPESVNAETRFARVHHYTFDSKYEVIDCFYETIDFLHAAKILKRSRRC